MLIQSTDSLINLVSLLSRKNSAYGAIFFWMGGIQIFPWWPLRVTLWFYIHFYQCNQYNSRWNFNLIYHGNICLHQWLFSWLLGTSLSIVLLCKWKNQILPLIGITHFLNTSNSTAPPQKVRILLLLLLLRSAIIIIQSGHNWAQARRSLAPNLIILFITKNHTHTGYMPYTTYSSTWYLWKYSYIWWRIPPSAIY